MRNLTNKDSSIKPNKLQHWFKNEDQIHFAHEDIKPYLCTTKILWKLKTILKNYFSTLSITGILRRPGSWKINGEIDQERVTDCNN
jgi:hypothetical protein